MNILWASFILLSFVAALGQFLWLDNIGIFSQLMQAIFDMARLSIEIALGLVGLLCFWMGIFKLAEDCGALPQLARLFTPLFRRLMPELPANHPAFGHISMNMIANVFGLDNAATPAGIKAMQSMQEVNPLPEQASNAQILFLVLNTSSVTLFPVTILMYRAQQGAANPADVFIPILLATMASTLGGLLLVAMIQKIRLWDKVIVTYLLAGVFLLALVIWSFYGLNNEQMAMYSGALGNGLLLVTIVGFIAMALVKRVKVYDSFIDGAKQGFDLAVSIMPYLVAMLVAVGLLRASGVFDALLSMLRYLVESAGWNSQFIEALPTAIMKPFSGSGARAMMIEAMNNHGVDSFVARLAAIFQGSTETTFYVLAVYFGAVNIKRIRYAAGCGLFADGCGLLAAILLGYWFFA